jgi:hypothetical protein
VSVKLLCDRSKIGTCTVTEAATKFLNSCCREEKMLLCFVVIAFIPLITVATTEIVVLLISPPFCTMMQDNYNFESILPQTLYTNPNPNPNPEPLDNDSSSSNKKRRRPSASALTLIDAASSSASSAKLRTKKKKTFYKKKGMAEKKAPRDSKGQWTEQDDSIIVDAVTDSSKQPFTEWSDLAKRLPGRVGNQIRERWVNHLNPNINHLPFSREDDLLLWEGHKKLGKRWVDISTKYFNSTRSENHIKNRWHSVRFKKFISNDYRKAKENEAAAKCEATAKRKLEQLQRAQQVKAVKAVNAVNAKENEIAAKREAAAKRKLQQVEAVKAVIAKENEAAAKREATARRELQQLQRTQQVEAVNAKHQGSKNGFLNSCIKYHQHFLYPPQYL